MFPRANHGDNLELRGVVESAVEVMGAEVRGCVCRRAKERAKAKVDETPGRAIREEYLEGT